MYFADCEERICRKDGRKIYGVLHKPAGEGKRPLIIFAHELGNSHVSGTRYGRHLIKEGFLFYTFDFCGGSARPNRSDGSSTEMSILTEVQDLLDVIEEAKEWPEVDSEHILLLGGSQGAAVAALAAARIPEAIEALILMYPGFRTTDDLHRMFPSKEAIPEKYFFLDWIWLGKRYALDMWDVDVYQAIGHYKGPVLLLHGDQDEVIPLSYSERAAEIYEDCKYVIIPEGHHEFHYEAFAQARKEIDLFLEEKGLIHG
ncbi:MAG: alpha/beta hydrolase [Erysipelotrichaceae bacterium]|nr:alpha/beta hydrolase [Erysipelotrichaceae bacterium]